MRASAGPVAGAALCRAGVASELARAAFGGGRGGDAVQIPALFALGEFAVATGPGPAAEEARVLSAPGRPLTTPLRTSFTFFDAAVKWLTVLLSSAPGSSVSVAAG